jgi:diguanylate cyclase (GGDEF)-like protein
VLVEVARRLAHVARAGDFVLRWGGEEFLLLLRDVERDAADEVLRRVLRRLGDEPVAVGPRTLRVTASIGAVAFPSADAAAMDLEQAITQADAALYRAKREGRNRAMRVDPRQGDGEPPCIVVA